MRSWPRLLRAMLVGSSIALPALPAAALDWIVVPYAVSQPDAAIRAADRVVHALAERRTSVTSQHELKDLFLKRSRAYAAADARLARAVADARKRALDHAAYGRRSAARRAAEEAMSVAESAPEALSETDVARHVLDACLAAVRVDLQERDRMRAVQDAQRCRRLVPDLAPRESTHSAEVVGALAEAENELRRAGAGALVIESSAREPCAVFVQGRRLGSTPFRYEHAPLGPTSVFVECGAARSRVYRATLDEAEQALAIDPESDARVDDRDVIALAYASEQELTDHLATDARRIAAAVGARRVVLVRALARETFEVVRFDPERDLVAASVRMGADDSRDTDDVSARQAAEALALERRDAPLPRAFGGPPRVADPPPAPAAVDAPDPQPRAVPIERARPRRRVWTWSFGGATLGSAAAALGAGLTARDRESQHDACTAQGHECGELERQGGRYARAANALIGVAGGFACATVAAFFIEGKRQRSVALRVAPGSLGVSGAF